jgi:hypothetical protein
MTVEGGINNVCGVLMADLSFFSFRGSEVVKVSKNRKNSSVSGGGVTPKIQKKPLVGHSGKPTFL